jgi:hypothetical protein
MMISEGDRLHPIWMRLTTHLETRIALLRIKNEGDVSETQTARIRGGIAELKAILALGIPPPSVE